MKVIGDLVSGIGKIFGQEEEKWLPQTPEFREELKDIYESGLETGSLTRLGVGNDPAAMEIRYQIDHEGSRGNQVQLYPDDSRNVWATEVDGKLYLTDAVESITYVVPGEAPDF
jgi:hypothetical protein